MQPRWRSKVKVAMLDLEGEYNAREDGPRLFVCANRYPCASDSN
jgi:hypothetical protein